MRRLRVLRGVRRIADARRYRGKEIFEPIEFVAQLWVKASEVCWTEQCSVAEQPTPDGSPRGGVVVHAQTEALDKGAHAGMHVVDPLSARLGSLAVDELGATGVGATAHPI